MNNKIPFVESISSDWRIVPNKYLFKVNGQKVGDDWSKYQLLSLTTVGVKKKDINSSGGKVPNSYNNYQTVKSGQMVFCLFDLDCSAVFSGISHFDGMITSAYDVFSNTDLIINEFADYWFKYVFSNRYYKMFSKNIRYTITADMFKLIYTPVPPLEQQRNVSSYLEKRESAVNGLIENQKSQIEKLKNYRSSKFLMLLKDNTLFGGFDFQKRKFKTLATLCNGKEVESEGGDIPVYGSGGIFKYTNKILMSGESLLLGRKGTIDKPLLVNDQFWTVDTMFYTSNFNDCIGKYLFYLCTYCIDYGFFKSGSVLPSMTQSDINDISFNVAPYRYQERIVRVLAQYDEKIEKLLELKEQKIEKLEQYKKSMIYEYVTGKKRVEGSCNE